MWLSFWNSDYSRHIHQVQGLEVRFTLSSPSTCHDQPHWKLREIYNFKRQSSRHGSRLHRTRQIRPSHHGTRAWTRNVPRIQNGSSRPKPITFPAGPKGQFLKSRDRPLMTCWVYLCVYIDQIWWFVNGICLKQFLSDLRAIAVMATKPPPTTNHHQPHRGYFENVHRDDTRRHDDLFLMDDDLCGRHGDSHIEWNEGWRPISTPQRTPPITPQTVLCFLARNPWGLRWHRSSPMQPPPTRPQRVRLSSPKRAGRSRSDSWGSRP